jgi:hypothetical protein
VSSSSFVTADENIGGVGGGSRRTSEAAEFATLSHMLSRPRNMVVNTRRDHVTTSFAGSSLVTSPEQDASSVLGAGQQKSSRHSLPVNSRTQVSGDILSDETAEKLIVSLDSSLVISETETTYLADSQIMSPPMEEDDNGDDEADCSVLLKAIPFSPHDSNVPLAQEMITREKTELRRAYSFGSLSQPRPHRDFMQVDLSVWHTLEPQSPTHSSSVTSPNLEARSISSVTSSIIGSTSVATQVFITDPLVMTPAKKMLPEPPVGDVNARMIAQLQAHVASLEQQLAAERTARQELEELVTCLEQLRHSEIFGTQSNFVSVHTTATSSSSSNNNNPH